jgi:hypothetical protein
LPGWVPLPAWREFFRHRRAIGKPLSIPGMRQVVKRLGELRDAGHDLVASLEQTMGAGLALPVTPNGGGSARPSAVDRVQACIDAEEAAEAARVVRAPIDVSPVQRL